MGCDASVLLDVSAVEVRLGVNGELKYPSFPEKKGWRYPGIGEFQCYDKYMQRNLRKAAELRGHLFWAKGPNNVGYYNSRPHETGLFCDHGDYDGYHGRFFVHWSRSHAVEITAGYCNPENHDGYSLVFDMLKKHSARQ